jgi:regulator of protease activity HflC (stomatin/prohibitin superfamily)
MDFFRKKYNRIKNLPGWKVQKDYIFNTFSLLLLILLAAGGLGAGMALGIEVSEAEITGFAYAVMLGGILVSILSFWNIMVLAMFAGWIVIHTVSGSLNPLVYGVPAVALFLASSTQLVYHWDKAVILRFGRFRRVREAGIFFLLPFADRIAEKVDTRIRVTDFSAERTLTCDNVPVHVDAICFWMIWDAQRAVLELENFLEAVTLSAQTALRDAIGSHDLAELLSERDKVGGKIQQILDRKTNPWGITILSVEFTDIIIPKELEDALSRKAQAERERQARLILGDSEIQVAQRMKEANSHYKNDPQAFQLRAMNMVFDGLRQSKGSMILVPSSAVESMNLGGNLGLAALQKMNQNNEERSEEA